MSFREHDRKTYIADLTARFGRRGTSKREFLQKALLVDGQMMGVPFDIPIAILMCRKDLYDKHGLEMPTTMDAFMETTKALHEAEIGNGIHGTWLWAHGGSIFNKDGMFSGHDEQGMAGLRYMLELVDYMPAAAKTWTWDGQWQSMAQSIAAQCIFWGEFLPGLDGGDSKVGGGLMKAIRRKRWPCAPEDAGFNFAQECVNLDKFSLRSPRGNTSTEFEQMFKPHYLQSSRAPPEGGRCERHGWSPNASHLPTHLTHDDLPQAKDSTAMTRNYDQKTPVSSESRAIRRWKAHIGLATAVISLTTAVVTLFSTISSNKPPDPVQPAPDLCSERTAEQLPTPIENELRKSKKLNGPLTAGAVPMCPEVSDSR